MAVSNFNLRQAFHNGVKHIYFDGPLDEWAKFPPIFKDEKTVLDFSGTTRINSTGTRHWVTWMSSIPADCDVHFVNCPVVLVKNFTVITGFLKKTVNIKSFAVPYYSEATDERRDFIAERGVHFNVGSASLSLPEFKDSKGNIMEIDVNKDVYFKFLDD